AAAFRARRDGRDPASRLPRALAAPHRPRGRGRPAPDGPGSRGGRRVARRRTRTPLPTRRGPAPPARARRRRKPRVPGRGRRLRRLDRALHLRHAADLDRDPLVAAAPGDRCRCGVRSAGDRVIDRRLPGVRTGGDGLESHGLSTSLGVLWSAGTCSSGSYVNAPARVAGAAPRFVTVTSTVPAACGGASTWSVSGASTPMGSARTPPQKARPAPRAV